jgi:hypothetical protein
MEPGDLHCTYGPEFGQHIDHIGSAVTLHPFFGAGIYAGQSNSVPYQIMAGSRTKVIVKRGASSNESEPDRPDYPALTSAVENRGMSA